MLLLVLLYGVVVIVGPIVAMELLWRLGVNLDDGRDDGEG